MVLWDFSNQEFIILFILSLMTIILVIGFTISFAYTRTKQSRHKKDLKKESNAMRIYIIDFRNNSVLYFSRSSISKKRKFSLSRFYMLFTPADADKLKTWLYSICVENRIVDDYLEADMVGSRGKVNYFTVLKKIKYNQKNGLLHLESRMMRYISPNTAEPKKVRNGKVRGSITYESMQELIEKQKDLSGYGLCIRFYYKSIQLNGREEVEKVTVASLKNVVYRFVNQTNHVRQIVDNPGNEILLFDLTIANREKATDLVANIVHELKKTISINGYVDFLSFAVGVVEIAQFYQDFSAIVKSAQQACIYAQQHDLYFFFYNRSNKMIINETGHYSQEITRLLTSNALRYSYRAIINANKGDAVGFFSYVKALNSPFNDYMEMAKYSAKVNRNKEFFAFVSKNVIATFMSERPSINSKLFMTVSLTDLMFISEVISQIPDINACKLVLMFYESDFIGEELEIDAVNFAFAELKKNHIQLCLMMNDKGSSLDPMLYASFDYFVVGGQMVKEVKKNRFNRLSIHTLAEQLLKYKKPIIASDLEGWQTIELIVKSGITYVSSETIAPTSMMIFALDKKRVKKLVDIAQNYR